MLARLDVDKEMVLNLDEKLSNLSQEKLCLAQNVTELEVGLPCSRNKYILKKLSLVY